YAGYQPVLVPASPALSASPAVPLFPTETGARVVNGQGYTRIRPRESAPATAPQFQSAGGDSGGGRASGSSAGSSSGGSSGSSSSGVSSQGYSGGSSGSSGGDTGRTAQPR